MKTIPATLLAHKAQAATTLCDLLKIGPLPDDSYIGFTSLDQDVTYDDGTGELLYRAHTGFSGSAQVASADLSVDNAEASSLSVPFGGVVPGISQEAIDRGYFDKADFISYRVNYQDLTMGHEILAAGTIGEQRMKVGGMAVFELRSISQQFKQSVVELDSLTCRAKFGSQVGDERFPCGFDLAAEWVNGTVTDVGDEATRQFTASALGQATDYFAPGVVEWLTGDNAGREEEVEAFTSGGAVDLQFTMPDPIAVGDTFRIRRDCTKAWTGHNSCATFWASQKALHFRGEPHIPVGDSGILNAPGAGLSSGGGGTGETVTVIE